MTGYERVLKNVTFDHPDRIAIKYPTLGEGDIMRIFPQYPRKLNLRDAKETPDMTKKAKPIPGAYDEWGVLWEDADTKTGLGLGQPVDHPIKAWSDLDTYVFPDPAEPGRFDGLEEALAKAEAEGKWVQLNSQYCMFERQHMLRGYENTMMDFYLEKEKTIALIDRCLDYQIGIVREAARLGKGRIHSIDVSDDWGTQDNLVINPDLWREIFKPRYKKLADEMHAHGIYMNLHSCGYITDIMEDLIEIGVDIVNIHQPTQMGFEDFGTKFGGRICFDVSVDIQKTLPTGDRDKIEQEVKDIITKWGRPEGGIIAAEYRFLDAIGAKQEDFQYAYDCFVKYGDLNQRA